MYRNQKGFHLTILIIILFIAGVVGLVGYRVLDQSNKKKSDSSSNSTSHGTKSSISSSGYVEWNYDGKKWVAKSEAPDCPSQPILVPPVDLSLATSVLYPGQTRGGNYKPHGGFRFDNSDNAIAVKAPLDAYLTSGSRYIEQGTTQYLLYFVNSCGVAYRFDHLLTLSDKFQKIVDTLPAAKPDDSRTSNITPTKVETGEIIATEVGFKNPKNVGFDFGVYDLRKKNKASQTSIYINSQPGAEQKAYAVCWLKDWMLVADRTELTSLPAGDMSNGKASDYCKD